MLADLRFAARFLSKNVLFTGGVIVLLACGLAANTVIFSLVDALLLRELPVRDPERLVHLIAAQPPIPPKSYFLYEEYEAWKSVSGFQDVLAWSEHDIFATAGDVTERARVHFVTDNFFDALGTTAILGRLFTPADQPGSGSAPVVLSYPYWKRRFAGDAGVVGKSIALDGYKVLIVGVTPRQFNGLTVETGPDVRVPIGWLRTLRPNLYENKVYCEVVARLRAGFGKEAVRQEAEAVWRRTWKQLNANDPGLPGRFELEPASRGISRMRNQFSGVLWLLMGGVGMLMLLVCANVAGLLMARIASRRGELAVRTALGATRFQLVRQLFCEALLLIAGGAAGAVALSFAVIPFVVYALPPVRDLAATRLPLSLEITPDFRILAFGSRFRLSRFCSSV